MAIILLTSATTNAYIYIVKKGGLDWMGEWMDTPLLCCVTRIELEDGCTIPLRLLLLLDHLRC